MRFYMADEYGFFNGEARFAEGGRNGSVNHFERRTPRA
jgi:hypothetical protein